MRVKVRFNAEAGQAPMIVDLRFLPRIGEKINLGFRRIIEVMEVYRTDNDNRFAGIIRGRWVQEQRRVDTAPPPRPMPMPPIPLRSLGVSPPAPVQVQAAAAAQAGAALYADVPLEELAAHAGKAAQEPYIPLEPGLTPDPAL